MISKPTSIDPLKYYIVDIQTLGGEPYLLWNTYNSEDQALYAIEKRLGFDLKRYVVCKGVKAIRHGLRFYWDMSIVKSKLPIKAIHWLRPLKYDYPENRMPGQNRKTYRTIMRRRQRKLANK